LLKRTEVKFSMGKKSWRGELQKESKPGLSERGFEQRSQKKEDTQKNHRGKDSLTTKEAVHEYGGLGWGVEWGGGLEESPTNRRGSRTSRGTVCQGFRRTCLIEESEAKT